MANVEVEYSYLEKMYNTVTLFDVKDSGDMPDPQPEFDVYVQETYLKDVPDDEQPTDFFIESCKVVG